MNATILTNIETREGEIVTVMTKTRHLFLFRLPHTSVMPLQVVELGSRGIQFQWTTNDHDKLELLHELVLQTVRETGLDELRGIVTLAKPLVELGVPFIADDVPFPEALKRLSPYVKHLV